MLIHNTRVTFPDRVLFFFYLLPLEHGHGSELDGSFLLNAFLIYGFPCVSDIRGFLLLRYTIDHTTHMNCNNYYLQVSILLMTVIYLACNRKQKRTYLCIRG
jgi:hypothetical protein